ncbi:TPA: hypothetical protein HA246_01355 [Candidatus Woesearchaeota archaeon]|nr:hypothetical protein [Candidatus Woesearchaeota archaeon]
MKDDHEERIAQLQERLDDMKKNMDEVEEELEIERRVKEREKIREEIRREKGLQKEDKHREDKKYSKKDSRSEKTERKEEKRSFFDNEPEKNDDDKFRYDDLEQKHSGKFDLNKIKHLLTAKNMVTALIVIGVLVGIALLINWAIGFTSDLKANEGNLTAIQQLGGDAKTDTAAADATKSAEKKETDTKAEETKAENKTTTTETKTAETKVDNKTTSSTTPPSSSSSSSSSSTVIGGEAGKLTMEFDSTGIETDESKGYGRILRIKYKIYNKKPDAVKPLTIEYIITEEGISTSPKKFTLPVTMQNLPSNSEVAWTIDYSTDNKGTSLSTYADTSSKIRVTLVLRDAAKKELTRVAKEFDV